MYIKKILSLIVLLTIIGGGIFSYFVYTKIFESNTSFSEKQVTVYIPTNATFKEVEVLIAPYVKDIQSFSLLAQKKGYHTRVKAGKYILKKESSNNDLIDNLRSKNTPIKIRFNNQERLEDFAGRISHQIEPDSLSLLKTFKDPQFLKESGFSTENALSMYIPNTYDFYWNTSAKEFRERMLTYYKKFWNTSRTQKAKEIGLTPIEVSSLASIVHKETVKIDERPKVAGVYLNRIKKGMRLQADPTVIYALKKNTNDWKQVIKRVLRKDLEVKSPYNTYQNTGIPPGPIFMADISAIDAVLNAQKHNYLFFVADPNNFGYHKFSKSLGQHNRYSQTYRNWVNKNKIFR